MARAKWRSAQIPSQKGRVIIVTGSSSGIGLETARVLANKEARVIIAARSEQKARAAIELIKQQNKRADLELILLDLCSLDLIRQFVDKFKQRYSKLDILINNAGVIIAPYAQTRDGFELQMGTNHLGHFALTGQLLDLLKKSENPRIVNISSVAHRVGKIDFTDINWEKRKYRAFRAYADSKIANLYFSYELNRRLKQVASKILVTAAHPGWTITAAQRDSSLARFWGAFFGMNVEKGALATLRAATEAVNGGEFYGPKARLELRGYPVQVRSSLRSRSEELAAELWELSESLTNINYGL